MSGSTVALYYAVAICACAWFALTPERRSELRSRLTARPWTRALIVTGIILIVLAITWWQVQPDGRMHVVFLDVGQGDAIFVETPSGRQVLIDGGPSDSVLLSQLGRQMPFWDRTLDMVALTHPDADHITGLVLSLIHI